MSSMDMHDWPGSVLRARAWPVLARLLLIPVIAASTACHASPADADASAWDHARAQLISQSQSPIALAIERWKRLTGSSRFGFADYAGFVTSYPGFPDQDRLRRAAEAALDRDSPAPAAIAGYFDRYPPLTNPGRAAYAIALRALHRPQATDVARAAWRGGSMSEAREPAIAATAGLTTADHDARIDALLWHGDAAAAGRVLALASAPVRATAQARLVVLAGADPYAASALPAATLDADPGFVVLRARQLQRQGRGSAAAYLARRPPLAARPFDRPRWISMLLGAARDALAGGDSASAVRIALGAADAFGPGEAVNQQPYGVRDDYTSLMWLGGTQALWRAHDGVSAATLFRRYADAGRGPGVRAKGLYWAGLASARSGRGTAAQAAFAGAAQFPGQFYGLLALERLGQAVPRVAITPLPAPTQDERARFDAAPLTAAVRELARAGDWQTTIRFFKEIAEAQQTPGQHALVAELARGLGRRDLGVIVGQAAAARGVGQFAPVAYPLIPVPPEQERGWTMIHAIIRQESQFAQNAVSHAGARGLMQMMPRTAGDQAGRLGLAVPRTVLPDALITDPALNITIGGAFFDHLLREFGGSYPLAVAAYNAGPGNVGKWLRANGDPRTGQIEWVDWIARIPLAETRSYVEHVLENAVVYDALNPARAAYTGPNPLSHYLGKAVPG